MERVELQLDEQTIERARRLAEKRHSTLETLLATLIEQLESDETAHDPLLGMFAGEQELIDDVAGSAMHARESHPLRQN